MTDDQPADDQRVPEPLVDVVADPERGRHRLPYLLGFLDSEARRERLTASLALCLVVDEYPDMLEYVVERLVDRLDEDPPVEVGHALDYLAATEPRAVDEAVASLAEDEEVRARQVLFQSGGGFARSEYLQPTDSDRPVGRTRLPGGGSDPDPRRVRTTEAGEEEDPLEAFQREREAAGEEDDDAASEDGTAADGEASDGRADSDLTRGELTAVERRLRGVVAGSRFDDLRVLSDRERGRYGDRYRAVATIDGDERAVELVVFKLPIRDEGDAETETGDGPGDDPDGTGGADSEGANSDDGAGGNDGASGDDGAGGDSDPARDRRVLVGRLRGALERWTAVDDHERVLTVHDWGVQPRPWAALEYTGATLADRDAVGVDAAVATVLSVADAVGHAHQHGVVHGALDPVNVAYPGTALTDSERRRPLVANPGLTMAYAGATDPRPFVDPRYAPPEYYDDRFGSVDHATDVYGLGLLLYRLCTGEHPYDGATADREGVLAGDPLVPSAVDPDLPPALDQVVAKATATRKLKRYETTTVFRRELREVATGGE